MARGKSGRIVIDVDPKIKQELYVALALSGTTLKEWFLRHATADCARLTQPDLFEGGTALNIRPIVDHAE